MNVWVVTIYEPLPFGDAKTRPQRCGMLVKALLDRGHTVELWTSAFDHVSHKHYHMESLLEKAGERFSIQFIKGCGYPNDISPRRFIHNRQTGKEFTRLAIQRHKSPDMIFAPVPIMELAEAAVQYAGIQNIPVIVDVRDLWPDIYLTMAPRIFHPFTKMLLYPEYKRAEFIFKNSTGITAVSKAYLNKGLSYAQRAAGDTDKYWPLGSEDTFKPERMQSDHSVIKEYGIDDHQFIVTYVGTFSKFYDIRNILNAAKLLTEHKEIRIFIIGQGEGGSDFLETAKKLPNVTMTGWLNTSKVQNILAKTKLGLVAYSKEALMSLPNKPFEYMAASLPLLSSLPGELAELINEHNIGRNYIAGDPVSLACEIRWFYEHPEETYQMGQTSHLLFTTKYRSDLVYNEFSEYLERIVKQHNDKR